MTSRRSIVLLGSSGFLGRALRPVLEQAGFGRVVTVSLDDDTQRAGHIKLDLAAADVSEIRSVFAEANAAGVVNCSGSTGGTRPELIRLNVLVVAKLIDALSGFDNPRYVHIGSAAEYGPGLEGALTSEETSPIPSTAYGIAKLAATMLIRQAADAGQINATVLRLFNPVGPGMPPSTLLGNAARQMREAQARPAQSIRLGRLDGYRDFIDCRDVASAVTACLRNPGRACEVYNVGRGAGVSLKTIIEQLAAIAEFGGSIETDGAGSSTSDAVSWQAADVTRLKNDTGWRPVHSLDDALRSLWNSAMDRRSDTEGRITP